MTWALAFLLCLSGAQQLYRPRATDPVRPEVARLLDLGDEVTHIFARLDTTADGQLRSGLWWAESAGPIGQDLPEDAFWGILDGLGSGKEWVETSLRPKTLGARERPLQTFVCHECSPAYLAWTMSAQDGVKLHVDQFQGKSENQLGPAPGLTSDNILSAAKSQKMAWQTQDCRKKGGLCTISLQDQGSSWVWARKNPAASWQLSQAQYPGEPFWNPSWDWDSLRQENPKEFRQLLANWLDSQADLMSHRLLLPIQSLLGASVSLWTDRKIPGLQAAALADSLSRLATPPKFVVFWNTAEGRAGIDADGRWWLTLGAAP